MSVIYGASLGTSLHGQTQDEIIEILKQIVLQGCCLSFNDLLADGRMATFQFSYNRETQEETALCTFSEPTPALLAANVQGSAPSRLFAHCLDGVFIILPDSFAEAETDLPFFSAQAETVKLHTYEMIIPRVARELATLRDMSHPKWDSIDADPQRYLAFNDQLLDQMKQCEKAQCIFTFGW